MITKQNAPGDVPNPNTAPAIILFGTDDSGKPHASTFTLDQRHDAIRAAGLMGFRALVVEGDQLTALAQQIPVGKVFESGKGFVPFVKREVGGVLAKLAMDQPDKLIAVPAVASDAGNTKTPPLPTSDGQAVKHPKHWSDLKAGSRLLAVDDPDDGWWEAEVVNVHESGTQGHPMPMLTLKWVAFPDDPQFVRRLTQVAMLHPAFSHDSASGAV